MPLHRHESLRSLSRDHHLALQLARGIQLHTSPLLRARLPAEPRALAEHVCRVFREELEPHFAAEDAVIAAAIAGRDAELQRVWRDLENEHAELRTLVRKLGGASVDDAQIADILDAFGGLLEQHVRKEERTLFPRIQELLDGPALDRLGASLERHLTAQ